MTLSQGLGWQEHRRQVGIHICTGTAVPASDTLSSHHCPQCAQTKNRPKLPFKGSSTANYGLESSFACNHYFGYRSPHIP